MSGATLSVVLGRDRQQRWVLSPFGAGSGVGSGGHGVMAVVGVLGVLGVLGVMAARHLLAKNPVALKQRGFFSGGLKRSFKACRNDASRARAAGA